MPHDIQICFPYITPRITCSERNSSSNDVMVSSKHSKMAFPLRRWQRRGTNAGKY